MFRFPVALENALESLGISQTAFSEKCGLSQSDVSKVLSRRRPVGARVRDRILSALPRHHRLRLVEAWLWDCCPKPYRDHVQIQVASKAQPPDERYPHLSDTQRKVMEWCERAVEDEKTFNMLIHVKSVVPLTDRAGSRRSNGPGPAQP